MKAEEVKPYGATGTKGEQVEAMFDSIAPAYDFMNTAMTFGMHRRWLKKSLKEGARRLSGSPRSIIDLATGTGDVAFSLASMFPEAEITGVDLSEGMLGIAREKARSAKGGNRVEFVQGDCMALSCPDESYDLLTIAYGVRNFQDLGKGFREFHRILKPGAAFMILELSRPENRVVRPCYDLYARGVIPLIGRMVSRDRRAYSYLPESIAAMPPRRRILEMLGEAGFREVKAAPLTLGVVTCYTGVK